MFVVRDQLVRLHIFFAYLFISARSSPKRRLTGYRLNEVTVFWYVTDLRWAKKNGLGEWFEAYFSFGILPILLNVFRTLEKWHLRPKHSNKATATHSYLYLWSQLAGKGGAKFAPSRTLTIAQKRKQIHEALTVTFSAWLWLHPTYFNEIYRFLGKWGILVKSSHVILDRKPQMFYSV